MGEMFPFQVPLEQATCSSKICLHVKSSVELYNDIVSDFRYSFQLSYSAAGEYGFNAFFS